MAYRIEPISQIENLIDLTVETRQAHVKIEALGGLSMSRTSIVIFILLTSTFIAFQNCGPMAQDQQMQPPSTTNLPDDSQDEEVACTERQTKNVLTTRLPGAFGQGDRIREIVIDNLNFNPDVEVRLSECDYSFDDPNLISWTQESDEALIEIVFNDELNELFFNEDGSPKKGATYHYSYSVKVNWYESCDTTETTLKTQSASQQLAWEVDETYIDENGCEVDLREEFVDYFQQRNL